LLKLTVHVLLLLMYGTHNAKYKEQSKKTKYI